jgi:ABC-2 type transport system permease protein
LAVLLRRALAAEWTRIWTLRSTWWSLGGATLLMLFIAAAAGSGNVSSDPAPIWHAGQVAMVPAQFAFLLVVMLAVTGEYSTGAIRSTLQWAPRRGVVAAARLLVPVGFVALAGVIAAVAADLVAWALLGETAAVVTGDILVSLGRVALVIGFGGLLAAGLGLLLRNTAGTLTAIFLLILALPIALGNTGVPWLVTFSDFLPGRAVVSLLVVDEVELAGSTIAIVIATWSVAAVVAGIRSLIQRDAR